MFPCLTQQKFLIQVIFSRRIFMCFNLKLRKPCREITLETIAVVLLFAATVLIILLMLSSSLCFKSSFPTYTIVFFKKNFRVYLMYDFISSVLIPLRLMLNIIESPIMKPLYSVQKVVIVLRLFIILGNITFPSSTLLFHFYFFNLRIVL